MRGQAGARSVCVVRVRIRRFAARVASLCGRAQNSDCIVFGPVVCAALRSPIPAPPLSGNTTRQMSIHLYGNADGDGVTWTFLSVIANTSTTHGLWEPELSVDASGHLVAYYSDETMVCAAPPPLVSFRGWAI
jgi:hypothetical protein